MTCNSSIQNHNFMSFYWFLVEIEYEISFRRYLLENYDLNTSIPNQIFFNFVPIFGWN